MPRHDLDLLALVSGIALAWLGLALLVERDLGEAGRWIWPVLLIVVGVVGLAGSRSRARTTAQPAAESGRGEGVEGGPGHVADGGPAL